MLQPPEKTTRTWTPKRVLFTPDALQKEHGQRILKRVIDLDISYTLLPSNRITGLRGSDERATYRLAKSTLAVVNAPASQFRLQPIPPSADFQFHLAQGCPAHCHYCYLAGSLSGPPVVRAYANLDDILQNLKGYRQPGRTVSMEASCYTDPLGLEHLTGSLSRTIEFFGATEGLHLRWVSKFAAVGPLLHLDHGGRTRARISLNAEGVARRLEGGTATLGERTAALVALARQGYPVGVVLAPIIAAEGWTDAYSQVLDDLRSALPEDADLTFELITHRFTDSSREVQQAWYPNTTLDLGAEGRTLKRTKFGSGKWVYRPEVMKALKAFLEEKIRCDFPRARILYFT